MADRNYAMQEIASFFSKGAAAVYAKGEVISQPYSYAQSVHLIETGFVKVVSPDKYGLQNILCILGPGDILPFPGGFGLYKVESFYTAMSDVKTKHVSSELLLHVVENNRVIALAIIWHVYDLLMAYRNRVNTLALKGKGQRIASFLLLLNNRYGVRQKGEIILKVPLTHSEIAASISATRESVSRYMAILSRENIIEQRNHLIIIKNLRELEELLQI